MTLAWPSSPVRTMRSFVILLFRIIIIMVTPVGPSPMVAMTVRAAADRAVLILRVVDDDLCGTAGSCC